MKSSLYGTYRQVEFNARDIIYVLESGYKCDTHFLNGTNLPLSWADMKVLLNKMPRLYSYNLGCGVYLNPREISLYSNGLFSDITFRNGETLKQLSGSDFDHYLHPILKKLEQEEMAF